MACIQESANRRRKPYAKVKAYMVERGISQKEIALFLDKSQSALNQNLNGTGGDFSLSDVRALADEYQIPIEYFF